MSRTVKPFAFVGVIVGGLLAVAAVVFAYWGITGSGSAPGSVSDLATPSITSATGSADSVSLDWTDVPAPSGGAIDGYYVVRYAGATPSAACASSPSTLLTSSACTDSAVAAGTYTYRVTAVFNSWTAQSDPSGDVVVTGSVNEPPAAAVSFPTDDAFLNTAAFGAGCSPVGICGTATDGDNVAGVTVSIQQGSGSYWNGTAFASATEAFHPAALANPGTASTGWTLAFAQPADGSYTVRVRAADGNGAGYTSGYAATSAFTIDTVAPDAGALSVNGVAASTAGSSSYNKLGGYAIGQRTDYTDAGAGIASSILTRADGSLSNDACSGYAAPNTLNGTPIQGSMSTGCYLYTLTGTDNAGNAAAISTTVKVDTVAPNGGTIAANNGNVFNTTGTVALSVNSFVDAHSGISSNTITRAAGTLAANSCGSLSGSTAVTVSGGNDSASLATGCYQYTLTGVDSAGNDASATSSVIKVDTSVPSTPSLSFSGLTNAFWNGTNTLFFKGAAAGGYTVTASSTDADTLIKSGNAGYTFGSIDTFTGTQTDGQVVYTFGTSSVSGTATVVATNNAGGASAQAGYSVVRDAALPTGGAVTANGGNAFNTTGTVALSVTNFSDASSGIASNTLTRSSGTLSGDACGTLSGSTAVTVSGGNDSAALTTGCYQYTLTGIDNVGNAATATSGVIKVDTAAPSATIAFPADSRYYTSSTWSSGCSTTGICGTATDTATDVTAVAVSVRNAAGLYWNGTAFAGATQTFNTAVLGAAANGTLSWNYAMAMPTAAGSVYTVNVRTTDGAGNVTPAGSYTASTFRLAAIGLQINSVSVNSSNRKATISGTAGILVGDASSVSVKICSTTGNGGPIPDFSTCEAEDSFTANRNGTNGNWSGASNPLNQASWHYAQVTQVDTVNNKTWVAVSSSFSS